jgi:EAL domain-containing protein (putative c-di-GMP-specific phosphodiesterase class I)
LDVSKKLKLYPQLTRRVIKKAFERFANETTNFSINLSIEDIADPVMSDWILQQVQNCDFAPRVIFEIVESEGIQNYDVVNQFIKEVKQYGVKIAIDDFGAGYSNFIYIMRLDIDFIKIDGSIIRNIYQDRPSQVITETIVDFARKLGIQTVAEFVSDEAVYSYVKDLGLDSLQGYMFGEPKPDLIENL